MPRSPFHLRLPTLHPTYRNLHLQEPAHISELMRYNPIFGRITTMGRLKTLPSSPLHLRLPTFHPKIHNLCRVLRWKETSHTYRIMRYTPFANQFPNNGTFNDMPRSPFHLRLPTLHPTYRNLHLQEPAHISELMRYNPIFGRITTMGRLKTLPSSPLHLRLPTFHPKIHNLCRVLRWKETSHTYRIMRYTPFANQLPKKWAV